MNEQRRSILKQLTDLNAKPIAIIDSSWEEVFCVEMLNTNYLRLIVEDDGVYVTNQDFVGFFISFEHINIEVNTEEFDLFCNKFQSIVQRYYRA